MGLSREQYAWFKEQAGAELDLARTQADRLFELQNRAFESGEQANEFARQVGQSQIDAMNLQMDYAKRDRERYEQTFLPLQDQLISEAQQYDTPERREAQAGQAIADSQRQVEAARSNADQRLRSMGLDPSQMRSSSLLQTQDTMAAAQQAAAANQARQQVENQGRAMRADAVNMGMGLPAQAAQGFAGSGAAGAGAVNAGQAGQQATLGALQGGAGLGSTALGFRSQALGNLAGLTGSPTQWASLGSGNLGQASAGYGNAANTINSSFQNRMSSWNAGQEQSNRNFSNIMGAVGMAAMLAEGGPVQREQIGFDEFEPEPSMPTPMRTAPTMRRDPTFGERAGMMQAGMAAFSPDASPMERMLAVQSYRDERNRVSDATGGVVKRAPTSLIDRFARRAEGGPLPSGRVSMPVGQSPMYAEGGPRRARGALPVRQSRDLHPAFLAEGEYVLPADVVRAMGLEKIDKIVQKYHRAGS